MARVTVDKTALEDFIKSAHSDRSALDGEFCINQYEMDASKTDFDARVAALDIKDVK